jgi:CBS domain containing-hemolysin-like protein
MAIVVDEYGDVEGLVTPLDVLEAIAGELPEQGGAEAGAVQRADGSWLLDGDLSLVEAGGVLGAEELSAPGYATIAGLALDRLQRIPDPGDCFETDGWRFEVVDLDGRRIDKVLATRLAAPAEDA